SWRPSHGTTSSGTRCLSRSPCRGLRPFHGRARPSVRSPPAPKTPQGAVRRGPGKGPSEAGASRPARRAATSTAPAASHNIGSLGSGLVEPHFTVTMDGPQMSPRSAPAPTGR
ncbi:unnamed protein product, partial [Ectocarpus sp. 6 AP-2014]